MEATFLSNIKALYRQYSFYVVGFISGCFAYWLRLPLEQQAAILEAVPVLKLAAPASGFIAFMIARGVPQKKREKPDAFKTTIPLEY